MEIFMIHRLLLECILNKILLLEDDFILAKTIKKLLEKNSFYVDWARNGEEALELSFSCSYDLYLFDINVPLINGDDLLLDLRNANDKTPAILLSALIDIESMTKGFVSGADDYIKKPFNVEELILRINVKLKKLQTTIIYKDYILEVDKNEILYQNKPLYLSLMHKNILITLIKNYPNPSSKDELMALSETDNDLSIRVNISKLKQKIDINIINIRGVGYKLA